MNQYAQAVRRPAMMAAVGLLGLLASSGVSPAAADDSAEWFGRAFKGTNLGQTAGIMYLAGRGHADEFTGRIDRSSSRADGARKRRAARGTRVASLGNGYTPPIVTEKRNERVSKRRGQRRTRVASLGGGFVPKPDLGPSLSGGGIRWAASSSCLNSSLRAVVASVAAHFGSVTVNSTCRSRRHNARVGGARHSHHLTGNAVDFRVRRGWRGVWAFLRSSGVVGGIKHYGGGLFHIDTGPRRTW
jgi:hypothetical protein